MRADRIDVDEADQDGQVTLRTLAATLQANLNASIEAITAQLNMLGTVTTLLNTLALAQEQTEKPSQEFVTIDQAAAILGLKRVSMYSLVRAGEVESTLLGRRGRRVSVASIKAFAARKLAEERGRLVAPAPAPSRARRARRPVARQSDRVVRKAG